jgi:ceramide glucosyltransferase
VIQVPYAVSIIFFILWLLSASYTAFALFRLVTFRLPKPAEGDELPRVTVLKPLSGLELLLEENLTTFCEQDYPHYQTIFSVDDRSDPAAVVAQRVIDSHPACDARLVAGSGATSLANPKIKNLIAAMPYVSGEIVVISDSDMRADSRYLRGVVAPFSDARVGGVTAMYGAFSTPPLASRLGALAVNDSFIPSVLVASTFGPLRYCFGATMAVRKSVLDQIGGIAAIGKTLADDYTLGLLVRAAGYRMAVAGTIPLTLVSESTLHDLLVREVRWARTVRSVEPFGYAGTIITYPLLFALLNLLFAPRPWLGAALFAATVIVRLALNLCAQRVLRIPGRPQPWLVSLREAASLYVWAAGLVGTKARWRTRDVNVKSASRKVG